MRTKRPVAALPSLLAGWLIGTCVMSSPGGTPPGLDVQALSPETVVRVHWQGKERLGLDAGAYNLMRIWALSESLRLEAQTLNKLATAPWRLKSGGVANTPAGLLRPLLDDVVRNES